MRLPYYSLLEITISFAFILTLHTLLVMLSMDISLHHQHKENNFQRNSAYHICQYDGNFRNCKDCGALDEDFDVEFCLNKEQILSAGAVSVRVNECLGSGLEVQFID